MRVGIEWCAAASQPLERITSATSAAGFRSLTLPAAIMERYLSTRSLIELDRHLQRQNVYLDAISDALLLATSREERLLRQAHFLERCIKLDALGGGILAIQIRFPNPGLATSQAIVKQAANFVDILADTAAPFAVQLALRTAPHLSPTVAAEIAAHVDRPNVGLAIQLEDEETRFGLDGQQVPLRKLWSIHLAGTWSEPSSRDLEVPRQQLAANLQTWHKEGTSPLLAVCLSTRYATLQESARAAMWLIKELNALSDEPSLTV